MIATIGRYVRLQPLSALLVVAIWVVCLVPIPDTPLKNVRFIDKWVHLLMYGGLCLVIMAEYAWRKKRIVWRRLAVFALLAPIVMSGAIELCQAYLTAGIRSGEWMDFAANAVGAAVGFIVGIPLARCLSTRCRGGARGRHCCNDGRG